MHNYRKRVHALKASLWSLLIFTLLTGASHGIVIRHDKDDQQYQALAQQYLDSVVFLMGGCVATLIDPIWVITADHCVEHRDLIVIEHKNKKYLTTSVISHPYKDMALIQLAEPVLNGRPALLYPLDDEVGKEIVFVGNGDFGNGIDGILEHDGIIRAATNTIIRANKSDIVFKFNQPPNGTELEGISGPGDSGGPAFIETDSKRYIAGISSRQDNGGIEGVYKVTEYYTRVSNTIPWINKVLEETKIAEKSDSPLLLEINEGSLQTFENALNKNPSWKDNSDLINEALILTIVKNKPLMGELLIENGIDFSKVALNGSPMLHVVLEVQNWEYFDMLMKQNIDLSTKDREGRTVFSKLIFSYPESENFDSLVKKFMEQGVDINEQDRYGESAMHAAGFARSLDKYKILISNGAEIDIANVNGHTALMDAAWQGNIDILKYLLEQGANPLLIDKEGLTALGIAKKFNQEEAEMVLTTHLKLN